MADVRLIDANALGRYISDWQMSLPGDNRPDWNASAYDTLEDVWDVINEAPTIDPETLRPAAHWESPDYLEWRDEVAGTKDRVRRCTACGCMISETEYNRWVWNYCPVCGAKMEDDDA